MQGSKCPTFSPLAIDPAQLPDFLNISQVSTICGLGVGSIRNYVRKGIFPQTIRFTPKKLFWRKSDILQFLLQVENGERSND